MNPIHPTKICEVCEERPATTERGGVRVCEGCAETWDEMQAEEEEAAG